MIIKIKTIIRENSCVTAGRNNSLSWPFILPICFCVFFSTRHFEKSAQKVTRKMTIFYPSKQFHAHNFLCVVFCEFTIQVFAFIHCFFSYSHLLHVIWRRFDRRPKPFRGRWIVLTRWWFAQHSNFFHFYSFPMLKLPLIWMPWIWLVWINVHNIYADLYFYIL